MENIKFLLKFGEKKYLQDLVDNKLYFNTAKKLRGIEEETKLKGQGDKLEGSSKIFAIDAKMIWKNGNVLFEGISGDYLVHYAPADNIPVCCFFAARRKDCIRNEKGELAIHLSDDCKSTIRKHFPKADSVIIIRDPQQFVNDVINTIGYKCLFEAVHYYHIDKGILDEDTQKRFIDFEYINYLLQDVETRKIVTPDGRKALEKAFKVEYAYRSLFCKDVFFRDEQELRLLLPDLKIMQGTKYDVKLREKLDIMNLDEFMEND